MKLAWRGRNYQFAAIGRRSQGPPTPSSGGIIPGHPAWQNDEQVGIRNNFPTVATATGESDDVADIGGGRHRDGYLGVVGQEIK